MSNDNAIDLGLSWVERIGNERGITAINCETSTAKVDAHEVNGTAITTAVSPLNDITSITFVFGPRREVHDG
jgi:hypothetical protein